MEDAASKKRKRSANISADEKLRFVRLLQRHGQSIISKATSNSMADAKIKENAWVTITDEFNASGNMARTVDTLKKLWSKLKSEAKTFKNINKSSVTGTGGGPGKFNDDPVLELVSDMTGRASSGITNIMDSDATKNQSHSNEADAVETFEDDPTTQIEYLDVTFNYENEQLQDVETNQAMEEEVGDSLVGEVVVDEANQSNRLNRRRPKLTTVNERSEKINVRKQMCNRFAAQRLAAEKEKTELILQQIKQNEELHKIKMKNEELKNQIMSTLLKRISDADIAEIVKVVKEV